MTYYVTCTHLDAVANEIAGHFSGVHNFLSTAVVSGLEYGSHVFQLKRNSPIAHEVRISDFYVSPNNPDRLLTLREKFWGSDDGGIIWERKPSYGGSTWADNRFVTTLFQSQLHSLALQEQIPLQAHFVCRV